MMNPFADIHTLGLELLLPVLVLMLGALVLGTLIGYWNGPLPKYATTPLHLELEKLRKQLTDTEDELAVASSILSQRAAARAEEMGSERRALEQQITSLNAQVNSYKVALVAARRTVPAAMGPSATKHMDKVVADPSHLARIADLERVVARVPALLKEVDDLRRLLASEQVAPSRASTEHTPKVPSPAHYSALSKTYGRRIAKDDLRLVEGIGPKIAEHLGKHGLKTWSDVATAKPEELKRLLSEAGDHFHMHDPTSWPKQCRLMVEDRWEELRKYQRKLSSAR
ncbi:MAG: hypothetical protein IPG69_11255 [Flavobacteriales bacterium]|nr:hypothetical protein [Flavobacteriales bacterium]